MLTRLEVDGFKNLVGFELDLGPYTCIAGPNAVGKSNIFDVIQFMSLLADNTFIEAAQKLRNVGSQGADPRLLFWSGQQGDDRRIRLAAEMIVPWTAEDDFGQEAKATTTYLRYELELGYEAPSDPQFSQYGRVVLIREELRHINKGEASRRLSWEHSASRFRDSAVVGRRAGVAYISTSYENGVGIVKVHQDGGSRGQPRTSPTARAPRTAVSLATTSDDPTILVARREMQQWQVLALEPTAMRTPDQMTATPKVTTTGAHLAATLYRLSNDASVKDAYGLVASKAAALTDVREVNVEVDRVRELLVLQARLGREPMLPARALSDGTLRFLALCIMSIDPSVTGLVCMEEPENGIHPGRIDCMVDLVRSLAVDPMERPGPSNPLRQVIVNTHSPYYVAQQHAEDLVLAVPVSVKSSAGVSQTVNIAPMHGTWRARKSGFTVSKASIIDYLRTPPGAQLSLDFAIDV